MKRTIIWILLIFVLAACQAGEAVPTSITYPTYPPLPTQGKPTPYPTYTIAPTQTAFVIVVTATGPLYTATATIEPTKTLIPSPTVEPINTKDKKEGVYLVGEEVAPGKWRASGDCYAVTRDENNDQIDMVDGKRSIIIVQPTDFTVEYVSYPGSCTWSYLGP